MTSAVVIPVFNGLDRLRHCIASLAWMRDEERMHLIVVDSGSTDGTAAFLAAHAPWIVVLNAESQVWWTGAVEKGCRLALDQLASDRICLLNHDCRWSIEGYEALEHCLDSHPDDIVCSRVVDLRDGGVIFAGGWQRRDGSLTSALPVRHIQVDTDGSSVVRWCGGMGVMFSAATYRRIGGFDAAAFPHYFGDSDFCIRGSRAGIRTRFCPGSVVVNDGASTGAGIPRDGATARDVWVSLSSRRSLWNLRDNIRFYARHRRIMAPVALARVYAEWAGLSGVRLLRGLRS